MKKLILASLVLPVMAFAATPRELYQHAQAEEKACGEVFHTAEADGGELGGTDDASEGRYYFQSAERTLKVAADLREFKGASKAAYELQRLLAERLDKNPSAEDLHLLYGLRGCHSIGYYKLSKALITGVERYHLDDKGRAAVKEAVLAFVRADLDQPMDLVEVQIRVDLLQRLNDAKLISADNLAELRTKGEALRKEMDAHNKPFPEITDEKAMRALPPKRLAEFGKNYALEFRETEKLRRLVAARIQKI